VLNEHDRPASDFGEVGGAGDDDGMSGGWWEADGRMWDGDVGGDGGGDVEGASFGGEEVLPDGGDVVPVVGL
jgi:hypothetical protein